MNTTSLKFINKTSETMDIVIIASIYKNQWVYCRHKDRKTFEFPGGKTENGESSLCSARRELYEETGAIDYDIKFVSYFELYINNQKKMGVLFLANIYKFSHLPGYEIQELLFTENTPHNLTYPEYQNTLVSKIKSIIRGG